MISLPYESCSVDTAIFMGSLHHLPLSDVEKAISEAERVLRDGGIMIIADANKDFDSFKSFFLIRVLRKLFNMKNSSIRKKPGSLILMIRVTIRLNIPIKAKLITSILQCPPVVLP